MVLADIISKLDTFSPFWINAGEDGSMYCENKKTAALDNMILSAEVEYITMDGEGTLTLEVNF